MTNRWTMDSTETPHATHPVQVVVRLIDGGSVLVGTYDGAAEASRGAEELLEQFAQTDKTWPLIGGRYLRPEAVVSIDVVEEEHRRWGGSAERAKVAEGRNAAG
jgi:hypothetical protein